MKFTVIDCEQRSEMWRAARCGRLTGSNAAILYANGRGGKESVQRVGLRDLIVSERLTGVQASDDFDTRALARGREKEPLARGMWEAATGYLIETSGFISADDFMVGASLDGHVGDFEGVLELKCPNSQTHVEYLREQVVPEDYLPQLRHNVWLTGAKWGEFVSFDDRLKDESLHLFRVRMTRAELGCDEYEQKVMAFLAEVNVDYDKVIQLKRAA